jgi:lysosomal alpha-mannosidase
LNSTCSIHYVNLNTSSHGVNLF